MDARVYIFMAMGVFILLEIWRPRFRYSVINRHRFEDSIWYVLNEVAYTFFAGWIGYRLGLLMERGFAGARFSVDLTEYGLVFQYAIFFILLDVVNWIFHIMAHRIQFIWETHKIHHTTTELSFLSAFRLSWAQNIIQQIFFAILSGWANFDNEVRMWGNLAFVMLCMVQHLNVNTKFPRPIEYLFVTPKNHFWHHSKYRLRPYGQNFGLIFSVWDHLFGTWYNPDHFDAEVGLVEEVHYTSFFNKMFNPFDVKLKNAVKKIFGIKDAEG